MKYFSINELCKTTHKEIANIPNEEQKANLVLLVTCLLDPLREKYGKPIAVSSGFRSDKLNKAVGGASTSQHCKGQAVDLQCVDNMKLLHIIEELGNYDQLIYEYGTDTQPAWVHVSYSKGHNRKEKLRKYKGDSRYYRVNKDWRAKK